MKKLFLLAGGVLGLLLIASIVLTLFKTNPEAHLATIQPTPTGVLPPDVQFRSITYSDIFSDKATAKKIGDTLQNPITIDAQGDYLVGHFASDAATFGTDVYQQGGVAKLLVQNFNNTNTYYSDFVLTHTSDEVETMYDPSQAGSGFVWRVFPTEGTAFFTNPDDGFTGRIVYFAPTSYENFIKTASQTLGISTSDQSQQENTVEQGD